MEISFKKALTCQFVSSFELNADIVPHYTPKMGDVALFKVVQPNGGYIMDTEKMATPLFEGDVVMLAFGSRYATNQYEGYVPFHPVTECQLLGRGGVAGLVTSKNALFKATPAQLEIIGYAADKSGAVINTVRKELLETFHPNGVKAKVILSVGSSMDSGKTTSAAWLCGGLRAAGKQVAYVKLTGTAFPKDAALNVARGAHFAVDFSAFGFPSTFLLNRNTLLNLYQSLVNLVYRKSQAEYIVMEIADGLLQRETAMLLSDPAFRSTIFATLFSGGDSLGVLAGLDILKKWDIRPFAVSGLFTASELLIKEIEDQIDTPVLRLNDLLQLPLELLEKQPAFVDQLLQERA